MSGDQTKRSAVVASNSTYAVGVPETAAERLDEQHGRVVGGTTIKVGRLVAEVKAALHIEYDGLATGAGVPRRAVVRVASKAAVAAVQDRWGDVGGRGVDPFEAACLTTPVYATVGDAISASHVHVGTEVVVERVAQVAVAGALGELDRWLDERAAAVRRAADRDLRDEARRVSRGVKETVGRQRAPQPALAATHEETREERR